MPRLQWEQVKETVTSLFCIWTNERDFHWIEQHYSLFDWSYYDDIQLEQLKVKLCAIANVYYEFCHEAYDMYQPLPDELVEDFQNAGLPFSAFRIGQLTDKDFLAELKEAEYTNEENEEYLIRSAVSYLAKGMKYKVFEELYTSKGFEPDSLFDSWKALTSDTADYAGLEYLRLWGDTFSN